MAKFVIFTDTASDLTKDLRKEFGVEYFQMGLVIDGRNTVADLDWGEFSSDEFYQMLADHHHIKTTLITVGTVVEDAKPWLEKGYDILYLGCSTALTGSLESYNLAKEVLLEDFPDRRMEAVQTYLASGGLGLLVRDAATRQKEGKSLDEVMKWIEDHRFFYNQFCTVDTLSYLKANGRISGAKAFFGNLMGVKPVFISDRKGNNLVTEKAKGTKASLELLVRRTVENIDVDKDPCIVISNSVCPERVEYLSKRLQEELGGKAKIEVQTLGPIIGGTTGPQTIATFFYGKEVTRYEGDGQE